MSTHAVFLYDTVKYFKAIVFKTMRYRREYCEKSIQNPEIGVRVCRNIIQAKVTLTIMETGRIFL